MRVTLSFKFMLLVILLGLLPSLSAAENRSGAVTVSSMIGTYNFDNDQMWRDTDIYTLGFGYNFTEHWQLELGLAATDDVYTRAAGPAGPSADMYFFKADIHYHLNPVGPVVFYLSGGGGIWSANPSNASAFSEEFYNYGGGLKIDLLPELPLRLDIKNVLFAEELLNDVRNITYSIGINSQFGGVKPQPVDIDADKDGIIDVLDQCLETIPGAVVNRVGCRPDSDNDGVVDVSDRCPATLPGAVVDAVGCPLDSDSDGVTDLDDDCPDTPKLSRVDERGCVAIIDADIEPARMVESAAVAPLIVLETPQQRIDVRFQPGSNEIMPRDSDSLKTIAEQLISDPNKNIKIDGYTDSIGSAQLNQRLSQERAEKIRQNLINEFNVDPGRIQAIGHGEENPIADNATQFGRRINRRVEVIIE
jgi:OOP family OmpA-OmpF porin